MLAKDGILKANEPEAWQPPNGQPHFIPKAKSVVWLFMNGGMSHARVIRSQAGDDQIRGQVDQRNSLR